MLVLKCLKHALIWFCIILPLQLIGSILLAIYLPIHLQLIKRSIISSIKLPYLLRWYDNVDQYIGRDTSTYLAVFGSGVLNLYTWLAFRNPLNYFGWMILGVMSDQDIADDNIGDSTGCIEGTRHIEVTINNKSYYEYYYIKKLNSTHCIRIRIGWKLCDTKAGQIAQWVFVISPWHSYNGI